MSASFEDEIIAYRKDGRPIYDNAPTVVVMLVYVNQEDRKGIWIIRRNTNPGKGFLALPGGFQMRETWQQAGARELREELGIDVNPEDIYQFGEAVTDKYMHNLIFGVVEIKELPVVKVNPEEVAESWIATSWQAIPVEDEWAFPLHYKYMSRFVTSRNLPAMSNRT